MCGGLGLVAVVLPGLGLGVLGPGGRAEAARAVGGELLVADLKNEDMKSKCHNPLHCFTIVFTLKKEGPWKLAKVEPTSDARAEIQPKWQTTNTSTWQQCI